MSDFDFNFELIDLESYIPISISGQLEQLIYANNVYAHSIFINFIEFISDIYKTYKFNIKNVQKQVRLDVMRSSLYINHKLYNKQNKCKKLFNYLHTFHNNNYVKILCLHTQAIYAKALELLIQIINNPQLHIFELEYTDIRNHLIMDIQDVNQLQFMSRKCLRIVKIEETIINLYIVDITIQYTFPDPSIEIQYTIKTY
jgi:hypothetical protein